MPFKNQTLWRLSVTLEHWNSKHCSNYQRFSQRPFHPELPNTHPQWLKPPHNSGVQSILSIARRQPPTCKNRLVPSNPSQYPRLARYPSQRVSPRQAPYLNEPRGCIISEGDSYTSNNQCPSPHCAPSSRKCPLCASRHDRYESI
jgi:hypothetical protein